MKIEKDLDRRIFSLKFKDIFLASIVPLRPTSLFFDRIPSKSITRLSESYFLTQALIFFSSCFEFRAPQSSLYTSAFIRYQNISIGLHSRTLAGFSFYYKFDRHYNFDRIYYKIDIFITNFDKFDKSVKKWICSIKKIHKWKM